MFQYSISQWILEEKNLEDVLISLKNYGYKGIELTGEPNDMDSSYIKSLLHKHNMTCTSICGRYPSTRDLSSDKDEIGENAVQYLKDCIDFAEQVDAPYIIVLPSALEKLEPDVDYETDWKASVSRVKEAAEYAGKKGVTLIIEAINRYETFLVNTLSKAIKFMNDVNHPSVKIMADVFHMNIEEESIAKSLYQAAPYLKHVHIADNTRQAPGYGKINFKEILGILMDIGYQGCLTMEYLPAHKQQADEKQLMKLSIDYLKLIELFTHSNNNKK